VRAPERRRTRASVVEALKAEITDLLSRGESGQLPIEGYGTSETAILELDRGRDQEPSCQLQDRAARVALNRPTTREGAVERHSIRARHL
jgi:hypothetical protein